MAYFAKLNENNIVTQVVGVNNNVLRDENDVEQEIKGVEFLRTLYQEPNAVWKQTSYNTDGNTHKLGGTPFRKNFAGIGFKYDAEADAFYRNEYVSNTGEVYTNWILNTTTYKWEPPTPMPETYDDGITATNPETGEVINIRDAYNWNDTTSTWEKISV
jgi:hypothetical protein